MPIPKPHDGEKQKDYISRCMGNSTMVREYPNSDQRYAVCSTTWKNKKNCDAVQNWANRLTVPPQRETEK